MTDAATSPVVLDMGYTAEEFVAALPRVFASWQVTGQGGQAWLISAADVAAKLAIAPRPPRRLGALVLPVLRVRIDFLQGAAAGRERFLRRFERGFHKGGG